jgi:hypothetical protein
MIHRFVFHAALVLTLFLPGLVLAGEVAWLSLLDANSLAGWDHSAQRPEGWQVRNGQLKGSAASTPLLSGWTFGNFELQFVWQASSDGAVRVAFPQVPNKAALELTLAEGDGGCQLHWQGKPATSRASLAASDKPHAATVRRQDDALIVSVDKRELFRIDVPQTMRFGLGLATIQGTVAISVIRVCEFGSTNQPEGEPLFNGQDLTGWWTPGNLGAWQVENGEIVLAGQGGNYLRTEKEFGNFTLSLEYKIRRRGNSGVGIRTARNGWPSSDGMELQIEEGRQLDASATMAIYRNVPPIALAEKPEQWNRAVIKADGAMISAWINGVLVQQVNTAWMPALKHRPPAGWIGFQDHGARTQFRRIHLIAADAGRGLDAWYTARPEPASRVVLDRLMNPQRLARLDGSRAATVVTRVDDSAERVLAELKGPGAMVRVSRTSDTGWLAFYFDGETKPRLECAANQLRQALPPVCDDNNPALTFLPYEKSLKIVLREASQVEYRIDSVTLPETMLVESFGSRESALARGMAPALDYRHFQIRYGTYQDFDGMPRATSGSKTLPPGERVPLLSLEGAGMVHWTRLHADAKLLANDDLWLEVNVDGQQQPAISTPVRMWYAGLQGDQGFHNFLVLNKGGLLNLLPMPFGKGITIAAVNRGDKPLKNIALTAAWQQADGSQADMPLRLVAVAGNGQIGQASALTLTGRGRWIGYVADSADDESVSVRIDQREVPAWSDVDTAALTGIEPGKQDRRCLSGRWNDLSWAYHLLAPVDFEQSLEIFDAATSTPANRRLVIGYVESK